MYGRGLVLVHGLPGRAVTIHRLIVEPPDVAVEWWFEGTHQGEYMGIAPSGRGFRVMTAAHFSLRRQGREDLACLMQPVSCAQGARRGTPGVRVELFYASDIGGSETCWRKFLNAGPFYKTDTISMGGDVTGKGIVPVVHDPVAGTWSARFKGRSHEMATEAELAEFESRITFNGMYPYRCDREELERLVAAPDQGELFDGLMEETFRRWLDLGEAKLEVSGVSCWVMPGNDDAWAIDRAFSEQGRVQNCVGRVVDLGDGYSMLSVGYSNPTPWNSPRENPSRSLKIMIERLAAEVPAMDRAIFNLHVPPYDSELDIAPELDSDFRIQTSGGRPG